MGIWYDIKKHECHSASFFVIPAHDAGILKVEFYEKGANKIYTKKYKKVLALQFIFSILVT